MKILIFGLAPLTMSELRAMLLEWEHEAVWATEVKTAVRLINDAEKEKKPFEIFITNKYNLSVIIEEMESSSTFVYRTILTGSSEEAALRGYAYLKIPYNDNDLFEAVRNVLAEKV